ncbi:hypothetical protein OVA03_02645 [Asticcacaulis sp. SL142]|uniref:phage head-tail joining protein n=1 Tax=Asticcacaulis sp. SL142 TaxID=2995155 RepID=UPI00226CE6A1|nr:hypothetical protein [Asticcacaulis sp. SL142]WAC48843.1 hypothetical protein OVA03_02645 [Asticcacaulis sp. SL142]
MASLTDLTKWRDQLLEARLSGVRRVRDQSGDEIEYKSDSELARALSAAEAAIAAAARPTPNTILFRTFKGV